MKLRAPTGKLQLLFGSNCSSLTGETATGENNTKKPNFQLLKSGRRRKLLEAHTHKCLILQILENAVFLTSLTSLARRLSEYDNRFASS